MMMMVMSGQWGYTLGVLTCSLPVHQNDDDEKVKVKVKVEVEEGIVSELGGATYYSYSYYPLYSYLLTCIIITTATHAALQVLCSSLKSSSSSSSLSFISILIIIIIIMFTLSNNNNKVTTYKFTMTKVSFWDGKDLQNLGVSGSWLGHRGGSTIQ
jgi:hypothetical protein